MSNNIILINNKSINTTSYKNFFNGKISDGVFSITKKIDKDRIFLARDNHGIKKLFYTQNKYGFKFAHITISLVDFSEQKELDVLVMLDTIKLETSSLPYEEYQKLYQEISKEYKGADAKKKIKENKYLNALQVKFSYSITCHKSQGGQWENVFVDLGYFKKEMLDLSFLRWLYTAITRASKKLYLINFNSDFFN